MTSASLPTNEQQRLETLRRYHILDTLPEQVYDDVAMLAARICDVPIAIISLVDANRQWFKAIVGLDAHATPREVAFCAHAILHNGVFVVRDASEDARFADNPLVTGNPDIRFYAGAPIVAPNGCAMGTVCVIDRRVRDLSTEQLESLEALSRQVVAHLELREQIRMREELTVSLQRATSLLAESQRVAGVGGWSLDVATGVWTWTDEMHRIFGTDPGVFRPTIESALTFCAPEVACDLRRAFERATQEGVPFAREVELTTPAGVRKYINFVGSPQATGEQSGRVVGAVQDISERRHADAALRHAKEEADRANRAKSEFLATMSHEIRTPMHAVLGFAGLLEGTALDERQRDYLGVVERAGRTLLGIIDDVLDWSKIEAGRLDLEHVAFELLPMLQDVVRMLEPRARQKGVDLRLDVAADVPACIAGDPTRLAQVLLNLAGNAVKFTSRGSVVVRIARQGADRLRCEVVDTGIGIPADRLERLFTEFVQADSSTRRRYGGTGLGLAISRRIVEMMGGSIGVRSLVGEGSTFWLELPLVATDGAAVVPTDVAAPAPAACGGAGPRVLLVEDNLVNQRLAREILTQLGCEVAVAGNGVEAVDLAARNDFDVVLMDCLMPEMDGYQTTREIRARERASGRSVPIVAVTANARAEDRELCMACGMNDYLGKPYRRADLERMVLRWAGQRA
jgi:signal transduction histidine kinase/CheY-like chemotaxis protein